MIIYDNTMTLECSRPGLLREASTTEVTCINGVSCGAADPGTKWKAKEWILAQQWWFWKAFLTSHGFSGKSRIVFGAR